MQYRAVPGSTRQYPALLATSCFRTVQEAMSTMDRLLQNKDYDLWAHLVPPAFGVPLP
jgi:hypothetical protein